MVLTIVMLGLIATYYVWLHLNKPNKALPPGPKPLPIVGNITNLTAQELWLRAPQWAKSYGEHLVTLYSIRSNAKLALRLVCCQLANGALSSMCLAVY